MTNDELRSAFEASVTSDGKWGKAADRASDGSYIYMATANSWLDWQACHAAMQGEDVRRDADRLSHIGLHGLDNQRYSNHVLSVGGTGDLADIRTFIDAEMGGRHG